MLPIEAARARLLAIEALQTALAGHIDAAQRELLAGLLTQLQQTLDDPLTLAPLLAEYTQAVAVPLALAYAESLLTLPSLQIDYFAALGMTNYAALKRPLSAFLETKFGITAAGGIVPGGWLSTYAVPDQQVLRHLVEFAYQAQASGVGLTEYRAGLTQLVTGGPKGQGLVAQLYQEAADTYNQADRALSQLAAKELGLTAYLYQGGLIASSRAFCVARDGKVFLDYEIARFGTKRDLFGGYTNKADGVFSGKPEPYDPATDLGGYNCRHGINPIPNLVALRLRPGLAADAKGRLYVKA